MEAMRLGAWALTGLLLGGCAWDALGGEQLESSAALEEAATLGARHDGGQRWQRLKVMSFNIFYGGDELDLETGDFCAEPDGCQQTFQQVVETIRASGADVVGIQEPKRNTARLAQELGWHYDERNHVISRFPLLDPPDGDGVYVYVQLEPGKVAAISNTHLPSDPYGPYLVRDGGTRKQLERLERRARLPYVQRQLVKLPRVIERGIPVFLTGDFNSPSHLDWTPAVARARADVRFPFIWPVSEALGKIGLRDSYREAHADPVAVPGFTWTAGGPEADPQEVFDRIDWVLTAGPTRTLSSRTVGEAGGPDVDIERAPYPSDHRAVVSSFELQPAATPLLVAVSQRRVFVGDELTVSFHGQGRRGETVALARLNDGPGRRAQIVSSAAAGKAGERDGRVPFETDQLRPGSYEAWLRDAQGDVLSRTPFWLYRSSEPTTLQVEARRYRQGEAIEARLRNAPGRGWDWVGVFRCDAAGCAENGDYLTYEYTGGAIEGRVSIGAAARDGAESWPLPPGRYVLRLLTDDSYVDLATSQPFTITDR